MTAHKPFVLFFNPVKHASDFYKKLQDVARTEVVTSKTRDEFFKDLQDKYHDIFAIYRTSASGAVSIQQVLRCFIRANFNLTLSLMPDVKC